MRSWLSALNYGREVQEGERHTTSSLYSLSNKMGNSLLAVKGITHKYIVVVGGSIVINKFLEKR